MEMMRYYSPILPEGSKAVLHALKTCRVLKKEQLIKLNQKYSEPYAEKLLKTLERKNLLYTDNFGYVSVERGNFFSSRGNVASFWMLLEWIDKVGDRYSRGNYPAEIVFTLNNTNIEIIVCLSDGQEELGHLIGRQEPAIPTRYIIIFFNEKMLLSYDKNKLPNHDFLFVSIKYDKETDLPLFKYHYNIKRKSEKGEPENEEETPW